MDKSALWLIVVFCVALAGYIVIRSRRVSKKNKQ